MTTGRKTTRTSGDNLPSRRSAGSFTSPKFEPVLEALCRHGHKGTCDAPCASLTSGSQCVPQEKGTDPRRYSFGTSVCLCRIRRERRLFLLALPSQRSGRNAIESYDGSIAATGPTGVIAPLEARPGRVVVLAQSPPRGQK